jgi:hypothetical protein
MTSGRALWARAACDPELPGELRRLIGLGTSASRGQQRHLNRQLDQFPGRVIFPVDLDWDMRTLLARAQRAVDEILGSDILAAGLFDADEPALRRHEWDIACALRSFTSVRALPASDADVGEMTAAVVDAQQQALDVAVAATTRRISSLEHYAGQVATADAGLRDWQSSLRQAGLNDAYLDLLARTAADELAVSELGQLTDRAAQMAAALAHGLGQAAAAAEVLALPPRAG